MCPQPPPPCPALTADALPGREQISPLFQDLLTSKMFLQLGREQGSSGSDLSENWRNYNNALRYSKKCGSLVGVVSGQNACFGFLRLSTAGGVSQPQGAVSGLDYLTQSCKRVMLRQLSDQDLLQARSYCIGFNFLLLHTPACFHTGFTSQAQVFLAMYI